MPGREPAYIDPPREGTTSPPMREQAPTTGLEKSEGSWDKSVTGGHEISGGPAGAHTKSRGASS